MCLISVMRKYRISVVEMKKSLFVAEEGNASTLTLGIFISVNLIVIVYVFLGQRSILVDCDTLVCY